MNFVGILLLATLIEGFTEYAFGTVKPIQPYLKYIALVLGVGATVAYKIDLLAVAGLTTAAPIVGYVVSGLVVGRGSNYLNDIISAVRGDSSISVVPKPPAIG